MVRILSRLSPPTLMIGVIFGCCLVFLLRDVSFLNNPHRTFRISSTNFLTKWNETKQVPKLDARPSHFDDLASLKHSATAKDNNDTTTRSHLFEQTRVLCWVLTSPSNHKTRAMAVKNTWGKRCNILLFMNSAKDPDLPSVQLPVVEGRTQLWGKTREAFRYIWNHYRDQADWFFKADDDTYAIMENMRYFLSSYNTSHPLWFGHKFKTLVKQGYFSGGAGYVLSKEATRRFVEEGYFNVLLCRHNHEGAEDAEMGKCMSRLNVSAMDTRDSAGRERFLPFGPERHIFPGKIVPNYWYWQSIYYPPKKGFECCSDSAISFHYVKPEQMYVLEYLIYQLRPFGLEPDHRPTTPEPPPDLDLKATPWFVTDQLEKNNSNENVTHHLISARVSK